MLREPGGEPAKEHDGAFDSFRNLGNILQLELLCKTMILGRWKTTNGKSGSVEIREDSVWREV